MKYGLVVFNDSFNLGDDIQSYAVERYLPHTDYVIERERLDEFYTESGEEIAVILAGWFLYDHLHWPPSPFMKALPISMHFDTYFSKWAGERLTKNFVLEDYGATWLIENGPIGARDITTKKLLEKYGIPNYFSGCMTLTIKPFDDVTNHGKICLVDVSEDIVKYVCESTDKEVLELTHSIKMSPLVWSQRRKLVEDRLKVYQGASVVITTRLHAALPCLALGTPVLLIKEEWSLNRIGTWLDFLNYTSKEKLFSGEFKYDFNEPTENPKDYKVIAENLDKACNEFIEKSETVQEPIRKLDVEMFKDGSKRVQRLQKLMNLRVDKYEKELYGH